MKFVFVAFFILVGCSVYATSLSLEQQLEYAISKYKADCSYTTRNTGDSTKCDSEPIQRMLAKNPKNVNKLLETETLYAESPDANLIVLLMDNVNDSMSAQWMYDMYVKYIPIACTTGLSDVQEKMLDKVSQVGQWDFSFTWSQQRRYAKMILGCSDEEHCWCYMIRIAKYGYATPEFLKTIEEVASENKDAILLNAIKSLRVEAIKTVSKQ